MNEWNNKNKQLYWSILSTSAFHFISVCYFLFLCNSLWFFFFFFQCTCFSTVEVILEWGIKRLSLLQQCLNSDMQQQGHVFNGRLCLSAELHTHANSCTYPHLLIGVFDLPFSLTDEFSSLILILLPLASGRAVAE